MAKYDVGEKDSSILPILSLLCFISLSSSAEIHHIQPNRVLSQMTAVLRAQTQAAELMGRPPGTKPQRFKEGKVKKARKRNLMFQHQNLQPPCLKSQKSGEAAKSPSHARLSSSMLGALSFRVIKHTVLHALNSCSHSALMDKVSKATSQDI
ncbi:hypothetical protein ILYODFUR_011589 [Ilyodon furcidens]|uniref:Uncharacterized protein n=1 Tax=Ilyodon furcidens TaxID=33524 RepID=A0ABV0TVL2_9TELE